MTTETKPRWTIEHRPTLRTVLLENGDPVAEFTSHCTDDRCVKIANTLNVYADLIQALRMCAIEFITLRPRLSGLYQKHANACVDAATDAFNKAGEKL